MRHGSLRGDWIEFTYDQFNEVCRVIEQIDYLESCKQKSSPEMKKAPQFSQSKNGYSKADRRRIPSPTWIE